MSFPASDTIELNFTEDSDTYVCTVTHNNTYLGSVALGSSNTNPTGTPLCFLVNDWSGATPVMKFGMFRKVGNPKYLNHSFSGWKPYSIELTGSPNDRNTVHFYSKAPGYGMNNLTGVSRGLQYISRTSGDDDNTTAHVMLRDSSFHPYTSPPTFEYLQGWCLAGKFPQPSGPQGNYYFTLNKYGNNRYRSGIEWIFGNNKYNYGFRAADEGLDLSVIEDLRFGIRKEGSSTKVIALVRPYGGAGAEYVDAGTPVISVISRIYFYSPSSTVSSLQLYNYDGVYPVTQPGTDLSINRSSTNPPDNTTNSSEVSTIRHNPLSYTAGL